MTRLQRELRDRLLDALERRGWSQADLARAVGMSQKHLNQMINGGRNRSGEGQQQHAVEGTLTMWQDCFDAVGMRVDVKIVRKPKVSLD